MIRQRRSSRRHGFRQAGRLKNQLMRVIFKIAVTELQVLFFSPVAWLILIVFTFQSGMAFTGQMEHFLRHASMGYSVGNLTVNMLSNNTGAAFTTILNYLYLYIPLITMGLMSRELSSGSIKMLYSSPIRNSQIILGKYLSMMIYGLVLVAILGIFCVWMGLSIEHTDVPVMLSGVLGIYLLICAYAAIGLFMSSLTSYQVVAAICTLATLSVLNYMGNIGQGVPFIRDITYWLSMNGRATQFIRGLISSEDVFYFVIVVALFLCLCIVRMNANRQKTGWKSASLRYVAICLVAVLAGYVSSRPTLQSYCDVTRTEQNTLTPHSQDIIKRLDDGLTIHTFVNVLEENNWIASPRSQHLDYQRFEQYIRFKPQIRMKYYYYYAKTANTSMKGYEHLTERQQAVQMCLISRMDSTMLMTREEVNRIVDLEPEDYRFIRMLERDNGERVFLRVYDDILKMPSEAEISAALKRLVMELPVVGFLQGHGERGFDTHSERSYSLFAMQGNFRQSLVNQGFDFTTVTLDAGVPDNIAILVVSDMRTPLSDAELERLQAYIDRGGNMVILGDIRRQEVMEPLVSILGVKFLPGQIVQPHDGIRPDVVFSSITPGAGNLSYMLQMMVDRRFMVAMPGSVGLAYDNDRGFDVQPLMSTGDAGVWNEFETADFAEDSVVLNPAVGEVEGSYVTGLAFSRPVGDRQQKIVVLGDADCLSNGEIGKVWDGVHTANYNMAMGIFHWMSDGEVPIDIRRPTPPDNKIHISSKGLDISKWVLHGGLSALLIVLFLVLILPRRKK